MLAVQPIKFIHSADAGFPTPGSHHINGRDSLSRRQNFQGIRLGVIDDQPFVIAAISRVCRAACTGAHIASLQETGQELQAILDWIDNEKINVLILDFNLTGNRLGSEIIDAVRKSERNIAVIGHTANEDNTGPFNRSGADAVVIKPATIDLITSAILEACSNRGI